MNVFFEYCVSLLCDNIFVFDHGAIMPLYMVYYVFISDHSAIMLLYTVYNVFIGDHRAKMLLYTV